MDQSSFILQKKKTLTRLFFDGILFVKEDVHLPAFIGQSLLYLILFFWGISFFDETDFAKNPHGADFFLLQNVNLIFHEAGHWIFAPFGDFMGVFGGSFMQLLMPLIVMVTFLWQRDNFEASIGFWWLGQSFLDLAPYIYDAWEKKLPLLGGIIGQDHPDYHDWHNLLTRMNIMDHHAEIAFYASLIGKVSLSLSFIWGGVILYKKFIILRSDAIIFR